MDLRPGIVCRRGLDRGEPRLDPEKLYRVTMRSGTVADGRARVVFSPWLGGVILVVTLIGEETAAGYELYSDVSLIEELAPAAVAPEAGSWRDRPPLL